MKYDFRCLNEECSTEFTFEKKISDDTIPVCPACGGETKQIIKASRFMLMGRGWDKMGHGL